MKKLLALISLIVLSVSGYAQVPVYQNVVFVSTSPTSACANGSPVQVVISTGAMFTCAASAWAEVGVSPDDGFPIVIGTTTIATGSTTTAIVGLTIDGVSPTTMGFVDPTSSIQTQLDALAALSFSALTSGTNTGHGLVVGSGSVLTASGGGFISANEINGTLMSGLATGILKNTTSTGVPSIAVAGDFPTLNQNTTGTAAGLSGTPALPSGTTATTQLGSDSSTKVATTAQVQAAIAAAAPVTSVSVATANGVSGSSSGGTTPALTIVLGAITPTSTNGVSAATLAFLDATSSVQTQLNGKQPGLSIPIGTATFTGGTGITSVVCATGYSCNNTRGTLTVVAAVGATIGTIVTVNFSATLSAAPACFATQNGGSTAFGIGNSAPTSSAFNITAGVSVSLATLTVNYQCQV